MRALSAVFAWGSEKKHLCGDGEVMVGPKAGARAEATAVYGSVFVIEDAEEIRIRESLVGTGLCDRYAPV